MNTTVQYTDIVEKELSREEIDRMVGSMVLDLCNILLNRKVVQHRDEARILLSEIFNHPRSTELEAIIVAEANKLLETGKVVFTYDEGSFYKNR